MQDYIVNFESTYLGHITLISNWRRLYAVWQICYCDNEKVVILTAAWNH